MVDQERAALAAHGHVVERFERFSDDIAGRSPARKALVPAQVVWSDAARRSLTRTIEALRPDVVHVHNIFPLVSPSVLYACRAAGIPVVATIHHYGLICPSGIMFRDGAVCSDCVGHLPVPAIRHGCYRDSRLATVPLAASMIVHRRAWRTMVSAYIFLSAAQRDVVAAEGFPPDRVFVKPNFVPDRPEPTTRRDPLVVYAGRLSPVKGLGVLMEAWDRYCTRTTRPSMRLVVAGAGPLEDEVASWAASRPTVHWAGLLGRPECGDLLARARAAVVPSAWQETFGLVVVEAMAAGAVPVASGHGSFPELIDGGTDGVLFEPGNPSSLAEVFCDMDAHPSRYADLGQAAYRTYLRRFTQATNVEQLLRIYRFAIDHPVT